MDVGQEIRREQPQKSFVYKYIPVIQSVGRQGGPFNMGIQHTVMCQGFKIGDKSKSSMVECSDCKIKVVDLGLILEAHPWLY